MTEAPGARATVVVHTKLAPRVQSDSVWDPVVPAGMVAVITTPAGSFFFSSWRRHTTLVSDWSSDVCSSDLSLVIDRSEDFDTVSVSVSWSLAVLESLTEV